MSDGTTNGGAAVPYLEDVFELPATYRHIKPLNREHRPLTEASAFAGGRVGGLDHRRQDRLRYETAVADALHSPQSDPDLVSAMENADVTDLASLTPLQAAVVEAVLGQVPLGALIVLWGGDRGLAFVLEAFIERCHLIQSGRLVAWAPEAPQLVYHWWDVGRLAEFVHRSPESEHAEAMAVAERLRETARSGFTRTLTTYLFPERPEWFEADLIAAKDGTLPAAELLPSVLTAGQATALGEQLRELPEWQWDGDRAVELTILTAAGSGALAFLLAWLDSGHRCPQPVKGLAQPCAIHARCLDLIARIPTEAAMKALVQRIEHEGGYDHLQAAAKRFPRRALRILAETAPAEPITGLLTRTVLADPDVARDEAERLGPEARDRIEALIGIGASTADLADLPEVLSAPPWRDKKRKRVKPVEVAGLTPPAEVKAVWLPGEREAWLTAHGAGWKPEQGWESVLTDVLDGDANELLATYFAAYGPEELVRPQLETWQPPLRTVTNRARTFVARYELAALPTVLPMTRLPAVRAELLQPFVSPQIAAIMADGFVRLRSMRGHAITWLRRHAEDAVRALVPTALGKPGKVRQNTVVALRWLEADGIDVVAIARQAYGEDAGAATKEVLADRGLETYPRTVPEPPLWARAALLSEIRLKDGQKPLPYSATQAVVEMLMFSKPDAAYPGLEVVKEVCDAGSLAEFAWSLCESWQQMGTAEQDRWALDSLGLLGDESTVARLQQLIRGWRAQSKPEYVEDCFAALARIGGDRGLAALHALAGKAWPGLRRKAQAKFDDVAQSMDLRADQLADRLVPTLGLTDEGTLHLDYGRRGFDVSLDEFLQPIVTDDSGAVLRTVPKPGKRDDSELATAAYKRFATLRKEAQTLAQEQAARLEQAMLSRRRWSPAEFDTYLVWHLLLGRIVRRLVWGVYAEDGRLLAPFRIAEDHTFADLDDARFEMPDGALIGVVHPADLGGALAQWSELFSDYEILQPFDQLGRPPLVLSAEERAGKHLVRPYISPGTQLGTHAGGELRTSPGGFDSLADRGWQRGPIGADRLWSRLLRPVGEGRFVVVELEPGLEAGDAAHSSYQAITAVWLSKTGDDPDYGSHALPLSELDAESAALVLRDLER